jgi:hypothetical protein
MCKMKFHNLSLLPSILWGEVLNMNWGHYRCIWWQKSKFVLASFLAFASTYIGNKVHNTVALMLDPHFKSLDVVKAFVGWEKMIQMVAQYNSETLLPLLVAIFQFSNHSINDLIKATLIDDNDDSIFRVETSNEANLHGLLKNELCLFCHYMWSRKILYYPWFGGVPWITISQHLFCDSTYFEDSWVPNWNWKDF